MALLSSKIVVKPEPCAFPNSSSSSSSSYESRPSTDERTMANRSPLLATYFMAASQAVPVTSVTTINGGSLKIDIPQSQPKKIKKFRRRLSYRPKPMLVNRFGRTYRRGVPLPSYVRVQIQQLLLKNMKPQAVARALQVSYQSVVKVLKSLCPKKIYPNTSPISSPEPTKPSVPIDAQVDKSPTIIISSSHSVVTGLAPTTLATNIPPLTSASGINLMPPPPRPPLATESNETIHHPVQTDFTTANGHGQLGGFASKDTSLPIPPQVSLPCQGNINVTEFLLSMLPSPLNMNMPSAPPPVVLNSNLTTADPLTKVKLLLELAKRVHQATTTAQPVSVPPVPIVQQLLLHQQSCDISAPPGQFKSINLNGTDHSNRTAQLLSQIIRLQQNQQTQFNPQQLLQQPVISSVMSLGTGPSMTAEQSVSVNLPFPPSTPVTSFVGNMPQQPVTDVASTTVRPGQIHRLLLRNTDGLLLRDGRIGDLAIVYLGEGCWRPLLLPPDVDLITKSKAEREVREQSSSLSPTLQQHNTTFGQLYQQPPLLPPQKPDEVAAVDVKSMLPEPPLLIQATPDGPRAMSIPHPLFELLRQRLIANQAVSEATNTNTTSVIQFPGSMATTVPTTTAAITTSASSSPYITLNQRIYKVIPITIAANDPSQKPSDHNHSPTQG